MKTSTIQPRIACISASSLLIAMLVGCAAYTSPVPASEAKKTPVSRVLSFQNPTRQQTGTIVVTRDSGSLGWMCFTELSVNGQIAARFDAEETASFSLPPGDVLLRVGADSAGGGICTKGIYVTRESTIKVGETKYFRISRSMDMIDIQRVDR